MSGSKKESFVFLGGAFIGLLTAAWLTYLHARLHMDPSYSPFCVFGQKLSCEPAAVSKYSILLGLPVSAWGFIAYAAAFVTSIYDIASKKDRGFMGMLTLEWSFIACVSIVYAVISALILQATCLAFAASQIIGVGMAVYAAIAVRKRGGFAANLRKEIGSLKHGPSLVAYLSILLAMAVVAGPIGFMPKYWQVAAFRGGFELDFGIGEDGRPWFGATAPKLVIHEYFDYECPGCRVSHRKLRSIVFKHPNDLRAVRHDFARMECVRNNGSLRTVACSMARGAYCAQMQGKYWEWNDAAIADPKPLSGQLRTTYELDLAGRLKLDIDAFKKCLIAAPTTDYVQRQYLEAIKNHIQGTPYYIIGGKLIEPAKLSDTIESLL